jgi:Uma2 family endonuclease
MVTDSRAGQSTVKLHRLTVRQYLALIEAGILPDQPQVELIGGVLVEKRTNNPPRSFTIIRLGRIFYQTLPEPWFATQHGPISLGCFWYHEPDVAIIRGPDALFQKRAPRAADLGFLIEVSDSSYSIDRGKKWRRYAASRVPIYWIVNLQQRRIEVYADSFGRGPSACYRQATMFIEGETVPVVLDGQEVGRIAVGDILPRP